MVRRGVESVNGVCEWKANLRLTAGQHSPRANSIDTFNPTADHKSNTVEALANLATATSADQVTVATLTDTIAHLSSELASSQAKLILSLLDNQKLLKIISERGGNRNTSRVGADRKISGGGATGPWYGPSIHYCHNHVHKCPPPSFKCPKPATGHIKNDTKKDIRGGKEQDYKNKRQYDDAIKSTELINFNNAQLFKSTVYVCHSNSFIPPPLNSKNIDAAINSVCSTHTWPLTAPVQNFQKTASSIAINVKLPNDQVMAQSHHGIVPISDIPSSAQYVKIFPDHSYKPLFSLGQPAKSGYKFQGDKAYMILTHPAHQKLIATRCLSLGMYLLSLTNPHSAPPSLTFPSMPTLQACYTRSTSTTT